MSEQPKFPKMSSYKDPAAFRPVWREMTERVGAPFGLGPLDLDDTVLNAQSGSPLAANLPITFGFGDKARIVQVGNRFVVLPMEGWDGTPDEFYLGSGNPTHLTLRRARRFGESGAGLVWGEAMAVRLDGRANFCQVAFNKNSIVGIGEYVHSVFNGHSARFPGDDGFGLGLQLTHSGRWCKPHHPKKFEPLVMFRHPGLDERSGVKSDKQVLSDKRVDTLIENFMQAIAVAAELGVTFVDIKMCHFYWLNETIAAKTRKGRYGGSLENRTRIFRTIVERTKAEFPQLGIGVRLSLGDCLPIGVKPSDYRLSQHHFGMNDDGTPDMTETKELFAIFRELGVQVINCTFGSPYYSPYAQRSAYFPPVDGKPVDVDPLEFVALQLQCTRLLKQEAGDIPVVGSNYTYLQQFLPKVAQWMVRQGYVDFVGLGRMSLSYHDYAHDLLHGTIDPKKLCRTFSDCTNGPRLGLFSGCFPIDPVYKAMKAWETIRRAKKKAAQLAAGS